MTQYYDFMPATKLKFNSPAEACSTVEVSRLPSVLCYFDCDGVVGDEVAVEGDAGEFVRSRLIVIRYDGDLNSPLDKEPTPTAFHSIVYPFVAGHWASAVNQIVHLTLDSELMSLWKYFDSLNYFHSVVFGRFVRKHAAKVSSCVVAMRDLLQSPAPARPTSLRFDES